MLEGLTFDDVILRPKMGVVDHRADVDIMVPELSLEIPLIASPMPSVASTSLIKTMYGLGGAGVVNRMQRTMQQRIDDWFSCPDPDVAIGLDYSEFLALHNVGARVFWIDVAHGHSERVLSFLDRIKKKRDNIYVVAGSVATFDGAEALVGAGADALRVGIGPGSVCTTRLVTGFGVPQLEAIEACCGHGSPVIADGGIRNSGDILKALAAGADAVMIGGLFARSIEASCGQPYGAHYGNASAKVNGHRAPEGISVEISSDEREPLVDIVKRLTWGLKSAISYAGARNIKELQENADWIKLTDAGRRESKLV